VRVGQVHDRVLHAEERLAGEDGEADLVGEPLGIATCEQELRPYRALGFDLQSSRSRAPAECAVRCEARERDRAQAPRAGGEVRDQRAPVLRHDRAERARVEEPRGAFALDADPGAGRGARGRAVAQRVGGVRARRDVGEEVDQQPAHRAVGPPLERARLSRRGATVGRREPEPVGRVHAPARQRDAGTGGERAARNPGRLLDRQRDGERRRGAGGRAERAGEKENEEPRRRRGDGDHGANTVDCGRQSPKLATLPVVA
jgi:hypothetical protein